MDLKKTLVTITPKRAKEFLKFNEYKGQRGLEHKHVKYLATCMKGDKFHVGSIATVLMLDGQTKLLDGQHQLHACIISGINFDAVVQEYTVDTFDTKEEVADLFLRYNIDKQRSKKDVTYSYGCQVGYDSWQKSVLSACAASLLSLEYGEYEPYIRSSKLESPAMLSKYGEELEFLHGMLLGEAGDQIYSRSSHLRRNPVISAMVSCWRVSPDSATAFWTSIRDGENLFRNEPEFLLREYLIGLKTACIPPRSTPDPLAVYNRCIQFWNISRRGQLCKRMPQRPRKLLKAI